MFIHDALLKYLNVRVHEMHVKVLRKTYQHLEEVNSETGWDVISAEYAVSGGCTCTHKHTHTHTHANMWQIHIQYMCLLTAHTLPYAPLHQLHRVAAVSGVGTVFTMLHPLVQKLESLSLIDKTGWSVDTAGQHTQE